ncbi:hypothetical protein [Escherichia coli]|nr:hypothetical protein [Escherichia coli]
MTEFSAVWAYPPHLVNRLDEVQDTLSQLMELYPESLYYDDIEGDEE